MGARINTIMQTCFFYLSGILPQDEAIAAIKNAIKKTYGKKGDKIVQMNYHAVDQSIAHMHADRGARPGRQRTAQAAGRPGRGPRVRQERHRADHGRRGRPAARQRHARRRRLADRHHAVGEAQHRPRDPRLGSRRRASSAASARSSARTRRSARRSTTRPRSTSAPETFKSADAKGKDFAGMKWTIQVAPEDCTGCGVCVQACPAKNKAEPSKKAINMAFQPPLRAAERENYEFFLALPDWDRATLNLRTIKGSQLCQPLFEYSGACAGCGETPYVKLMTQLFGDRAYIGNATGCSSIYGGNLPTTPYCTNADGRGPDVEQLAVRGRRGVRLRLPPDARQARASSPASWSTELKDTLGAELAEGLLTADQSDRGGHRRTAGPRGRSSARSSPAPTAPAPSCCATSPTPWSAGASGRSAATAGRTTSATAGSTTCWPRAGISTSWSWTRRCTPTPAGSAPRPRPAGRSPSSPRPASPGPRRTSA